MMAKGFVHALSQMWLRAQAARLLLGTRFGIWRYERQVAVYYRRLAENQERLEGGWRVWEATKSKLKKERLRRSLREIDLDIMALERDLEEVTGHIEKAKTLIRSYWPKVFES